MKSIMKTPPMPSNKQTAFTRLKGLCPFFLALFVAGCGSGGDGIPAPPKFPAAPQVYLAPPVAGGNLGNTPLSASTFTLDDTANTFFQSTDAISSKQTGVQVYYGGNFTTLARGLLDLELTYKFVYPTATAYNPPQAGGFGLELPDQAGGIMGITGQPPIPMVAAQTCPTNTTPQTFQFVTIPGPLTTATSVGTNWNASTDTAYGSVQITGTGETVSLANIKQFTLPPKGTAGPPTNPATSPSTGACASTFYGNAISIPGTEIITDPGTGPPPPPQAVMGIGPTGLLVESNGVTQTGIPPSYENVLGAGTGAIGLLQPSSPLDTGALVAAQYMGFFYGSAGQNLQSGPLVASFGFDTLPTNCKTAVAAEPAAGTLIYGGDFASNDPSTSTVQKAGGYPRCDAGIDLGTEDPNNNGLYPNAKVYFGTLLASNGLKYSFPAVAVAGQLNGKFAIFVLGVDTVGSPNQAWGIYLFQSN